MLFEGRLVKILENTGYSTSKYKVRMQRRFRLVSHPAFIPSKTHKEVLSFFHSFNKYLIYFISFYIGV